MAKEKYISGEEHHAIHHSNSGSSKKVNVSMNPIVLGVVVIVLLGLGFLGGTLYQKHHASKPVVTTSIPGGFGGGSGGFGGHRIGSFGQVTAVSASSITVQNQRTGTSTTYTINSSTTITDSGQTVTVSDIQTGDTVVVSPTSSGSTTAARILVNPSFGGGGGSGTDSQPSQTESTPTLND